MEYCYVGSFVEDDQRGMTSFQLENFVAGRTGGTVYGQYKQVCREIAKRWRAWQEANEKWALLRIDINELEESEGRLHDKEFEAMRAKIHIAQKNRQYFELGTLKETLEREVDVLMAFGHELKQRLGKLTDERRSQLEQDLWVFRTRKQAYLDVNAMGRISRQTADMALSLPLDLRNKLLEDLRKPVSEIMTWSFDAPIPALEGGNAD